MTILEQDLKTIKVMLMQKRGAYHISNSDKLALIQAMQRINQEVKELLK